MTETKVHFYEITCAKCGYVHHGVGPIESPQCEECRSFEVGVEPSDMVPCNQCGDPVAPPPSDIVPNCDDCMASRQYA